MLLNHELYNKLLGMMLADVPENERDLKTKSLPVMKISPKEEAKILLDYCVRNRKVLNLTPPPQEEDEDGNLIGEPVDPETFAQDAIVEYISSNKAPCKLDGAEQIGALIGRINEEAQSILNSQVDKSIKIEIETD